jgi:AraC-like DNA-binding protein
MIILQKKYGKLEVDDTESDHVQIWCNEGTDPQVVHIERENVRKIIVALLNTEFDGKLLCIKRYIKDNCNKSRRELADELNMSFEEFSNLCRDNGFNLRQYRKDYKQLKDSRKPPILVNK